MFCSVKEAIEEIRNERMLIIVDDENRENEGDLYIAAEHVSPEVINFMAKYARGIICLAITSRRLKELDIPQMVKNNTDNNQTAFTVSIDHISTRTGVSMQERAVTIKAVLNPDSKPNDFRRPGHVFPLQAREGGVLQRQGHTEASVELSRIAGLYEAGVICEIANDDGTMSRLPQLVEFAHMHNLKIISIEQLIKYIQANEYKKNDF